MSAFLGPLGKLQELLEVDAVEIPQTRPRSERVNLDGSVNEQRGQRTQRAWNVQLGSSTPAELAALQMLELGAFGPPPWVWVEPLAQVTNLLSPEQSALLAGTYSTTENITQGGYGVTADGRAFGKSVNIINGADVFLHYRDSGVDRLPVIPRVPVAASVYCSGNAYLKIEFLNLTGMIIGQASGVAGPGVLTRRITLAVPPDGAASAQLRVYGASQIVYPAFTWTPAAAPWAAGRGCSLASVTGLSEIVEAASVDVEAFRRSNMKLTVRGLG